MKLNDSLKFLISLCCCFLLLSSFTFSQPDLKANVVSAGGSISVNSNYNLNGSLGQSGIGLVLNSNYTHRAGFWENVYFILTDVDDSESELPISFGISQNYPNPFNPTTTIKYSVPEESFVSIRVYDILGRLVTSLVEEEQTIGYYEVKFNAINIASGAYFYRMEAGDFVDIKKLIILK
jgi:hypothetical protein